MSTELVSTVDEPAELQVLIAHHTGIGRAPRLVLVREVLDDVLLKVLRFIHEVIRYVQLVTNAARIRDGLRTTALVLGTIHAILRPKFKSDTNDLVALLT